MVRYLALLLVVVFLIGGLGAASASSPIGEAAQNGELDGEEYDIPPEWTDKNSVEMDNGKMYFSYKDPNMYFTNCDGNSY